MSEGTGGGPVDYLKIMRPGNCLMGAAGMFLAALAGSGPESLSHFTNELILSALIVIAFTGAGNSLNDYFDREVDKVAHPKRPIPSGKIAPRSALVFSGTLFSVALIMSLFVNLWSVAIVVTSIAVMVGYEEFLKAEGIAGNLAISWLTAALFLFGGAAVLKLDLAWILGALAFLATLGREIVKDVEDIEGDRGTRRTLPMRIGKARAGIIGSLAFGGAVLLSPAPYINDLLSIWYVPVVAVADGIFIYCALIHFRNPEQGQRFAKLAMLVALIAFLVGGVF